jgi:four helix bundle protein
VTSDKLTEEPKTRGYKDLIVWPKAMQLVKTIYILTREFPSDERFGLISQTRRAAVSVASNIAEGQARHSTGEFIQFISHAEGSVAELETQLIIAVDLNFCSDQAAASIFGLLLELRKMLNALRRKLQGR